MKYKLVHVEEVVVISIIDANIISHETEEILEDVKKQIEAGIKNFVFDLKKVNYLDSSGINFLIATLTVIRNAGGELVLSSLSEKINNLLVITKLNSIFNVYSSVEESIHFLDITNDVETN